MRVFLLSFRSMASFALLYTITLTAAPVVLAQYDCDLNGAAEVRTGAIAAGDLTQSGRVFRDGIASSCLGGVPTSAPVAGTFRYDQYNFTNPTGVNACVKVFLDATGCGTASTQINAYSAFNPANVQSGLIGKPGFSTTGSGSLNFPIAAGASFVVTVHEIAANAGCPNYTIRVTYNTSCRQAGFDRSNDGRADITVFRPSNGIWYTSNSAGGTNAIQFGLSNDIVTAGDYTGDNGTDYGVFRPSNNTW